MPGYTVVIRLPGPLVLRVLARSVLFAVALLFLPWLRAAEAPDRLHTADTRGAAAAALAELLIREGLFAPGARAVVLGSDGNCDAPARMQDRDGVLRPASLRGMLMFGDSSVDFMLDFGFFDEDGDRFDFADRVLKHGDVVAAPIDSLSVVSLPQNYFVVYIHRFAEDFVGLKKVVPIGDTDNDNVNAGKRMDLSLVASLKEGVVSSETPETTSHKLKNMARKLLLSDRKGSLQMPHQPHQDHSQS